MTKEQLYDPLYMPSSDELREGLRNRIKEQEEQIAALTAERDALRAQLEAVRHHWWSVMGKTNRRSIMAKILDADLMEFVKKGGAK